MQKRWKRNHLFLIHGGSGQVNYLTGQWQKIIDGAIEDASKIPPVETEPYHDLCYLKGYDTKAYYAIKNEKDNIGFRLDWNGDLFKCLWLWQERFATLDFPWWGKCYTVALEPWTSCYTQKPEEAIAKGEWLHLEAGQVVTTELTAGAFRIA